MLKKNSIVITVMGLLAFMALVLGLYVSQQLHFTKHIDTEAFNGTLLDSPRKVSAFSLNDIHNQPFNNASLQGHWTMVFFGFTGCGTICPTTMANLSKMYRLLETKRVQPLPEVVMISVDPERDSLDKLAHYVTSFNAHFLGAYGDELMLKKMAQELGIAYTKVVKPSTENTQNYDIEHTGTIILFNPHGELSAFFTMPHDASHLAEDYLLLVA